MKRVAFVAIGVLFFAGCLGATAPAPGERSDLREGGAAVYHEITADGKRVVVASPEWVEEIGVPPIGGARYTGHPGYEPTLGVNKQGSLVVHGWGMSSQVLVSSDQGDTWTDATPRVAGLPFPLTSNDPYLHVDPDTGRVFSLEMQALACQTLAYSDDEGKTWKANPIACGPAGPHDHPTLWTAPPRSTPTTGYPNLVHYCVNSGPSGACSRSLDGGRTWTPLRHFAYSGVDTGFNDRCPAALTGHGTSDPDGILYLPHAGPTDGLPRLEVSLDDGLTWETRLVAPDHPTRKVAAAESGTCVGVGPKVPVPSAHYEHEVSAAVDEAGNVYAVWIAGDDLLPYLAISRDQGKTWSRPIPVAPSGVETTDFATIAAGADGAIVLAYYGTPSDKDYSAMEASDVWNGYLTMSLDTTSANPTFATVQVNAPNDPLARGLCGGTRCPTDSGVGDFIDVVIDREGRPWAAFVDVCHEGCRTGLPSDGNEGLLGTLLEGPALRGADKLDMLVPSAPRAEWNASAHGARDSFWRNGTIAAGAGQGGHWAPGPAYLVGNGATSVIFELSWDTSGSGLIWDVQKSLRHAAYIAEYGDLATGVDTTLRVERTDAMMLEVGRYETRIGANAAVNEPFRATVTVLYGASHGTQTIEAADIVPAGIWEGKS